MTLIPLLLLFAWAMQGTEQVPTLSPPVATMTIESAKYCRVRQVLDLSLSAILCRPTQ